MRKSINSKVPRGISIAMLRVLRAPHHQRETEEEAARGASSCDQEAARLARARRHFGVRPPDAGETSLSPDEIWVGLRNGVIVL
jgi:hypothetical protein